MTAIDTGNGTEQRMPAPGQKDPAEGDHKVIERELEQADGRKQGSHHPENRAGADKATDDNDLTTGHTTPGDGGGDNAK